MPAIKHSRSFLEVREKLLSSMTPEERLSGLAPESLVRALLALNAEGLDEALAGVSAHERKRILTALSRSPSK